MPTKITSYQKKGNNKVASAMLNTVIYETMIRCAELNGYETISGFVKDAILEKCQSTAAAMSAICREHKTVQPADF